MAAPAQLFWPKGHSDYFVSAVLILYFFFPPPNLVGHLADRHQTLPHVRLLSKRRKRSRRVGVGGVKWALVVIFLSAGDVP